MTCAVQDGSDLAKVGAFCLIKKKDKGLVLVLELKESEFDPNVFGVPTFTALSSRKVEEKLKTVGKNGMLRKMLRGPHLPEELLLVTKIIFATDPATALRTAELSADTTAAAFQEEMQRRIATIGPLAREVLRMSNFLEYSEKQESAVDSQLFLEINLRLTNRENLPGEAKYFVAPHPVNSTDQRAGGTFEFRFLSPKALTQVVKVVRSNKHVEALERFGLDFQIVEARLLQALSPDPCTDMAGWERADDPSFRVALNSGHLRGEAFAMPTYKYLRRFGTQYLRRSASKMLDGELYWSTVLNCPLGKFFLYQQQHPITKRRAITFYATSTVPLPQHPFSMSVVKDWFQHLGLFDPDNTDVDVIIEAVVDWSRPTTKGMKFVHDKSSKEGAKKGGGLEEGMSLEEVQEKYPEIRGRLKGHIVRASIYLKGENSCDKF